MINASVTYRCSKCGEGKNSSCFAPSQRRAGAWCRDCYRKWYTGRTGGMVKRRCDHCAGALTVTARRAAEPKVFCSRSCKEAALKAELKHGREQSKPDRACRQCGVSMPRSMRSDAAYCSERCNSAAHSQTRKASAKVGARQERIDRAYIVARDKGVCHLCRRQVPAVLVTLDHIVPLALGGTHTADNLAVACLSCNCAKGSRPANEQLLLIG